MSDVRERPANEHAVGSVDDLAPGEHKLVQVNNLEIGVYNIGGEFFAMHNMCPHQFGPACAGPVGNAAVCSSRTDWRMQLERDGEILTCPWHGMEFDLKTGECLSRNKMRLRTFPVRVQDGEIRVQIGGKRPVKSAG
jgi:nitrite reductase/ring-hydroxylating ferredoxin subunit